MELRQFFINARIISNIEVQAGHFLMSLGLPPIFTRPLPGQFVMMRFPDRQDILLARPFSVSGFVFDENEARVEILYRVVGKGTQTLARLQPGQGIELSGPFGSPFEIPPETKMIIIVAGGIGVAPLRYLLADLRTRRKSAETAVDFFIGAKTADELLDLEDIRSLCDDLQICTDDCTLGNAGLVTQTLENKLSSYPVAETFVCACGPAGMIQSLAEMLLVHAIGGQASLEERMACGVGACLGCAVALRGQSGERIYRRVCREGPVFNMRDIIWE